MCNFFSAIVLRNGDVLHHWATDSHSKLVEHFKLPDKNASCRHFAKVEFTPAVDSKGEPQYADAKSYAMRVDEDTEPAWFAEHRESVEKKLRSIVKEMIVDDDTLPLVLDGCRILVNGAKVREMLGGRAFLCGGTLTAMWGGTLTAMWGGTLTAIGQYANVPANAHKPEAAKTGGAA